MKATNTQPHREIAEEKRRYSRYYEHDGMLRAYANRSMVLALLFGVIALGSLAFAVYVRLQPPTVVRVDPNGDATVVGGTPFSGQSRGLTFLASAAEAAPNDVEAKAVVRRFLDHYLNYTPATVDKLAASVRARAFQSDAGHLRYHRARPPAGATPVRDRVETLSAIN